VFEIIIVKGKKTVLLPWERLSRLGEIPGDILQGFTGLRGKIIINGRYNLLDGEKLDLILRLAPILDVDGAFTNTPDGRLARRNTITTNKNFSSNSSIEDLTLLLEQLDSLVKPAVWKKGSKELGFPGLFTDGAGNYWIRTSRGFHTSLNESISSLETLIDELDDVPIEQRHIVNSCYRRLVDYLL
jgi:hypothetical protein